MDPVTVPPGSPATTQTRRMIRKPRRRRTEDELDLRTPSGRELPY